MNLAFMRANFDFRQWSLRIFGNSEAKLKSLAISERLTGVCSIGLGFERRVRARGVSSAAAENPKDHCRRRRRKIELERAERQIH